MLSLTVWKTRWPLHTEGGAMSGLKRRKGRNGSFGLYYADIFYKGKRYRKSLRTTVKEEALKRFVEYYLAVERGDSQQGEIKFEDLIYEPKGRLRTWMYNSHILPAFKGKVLGEIDIKKWLQGFANKFKPPTVRVAKMVLREMGFETPRVDYNVPAKVFDDTQILSEEQVLDVIHKHVPKKYRGICLVGAYSMLRRGDLLNLRKRNVDFKTGWVAVMMGKTKKSVRIPISQKLKDAFATIAVRPLKADGLWFPNIKRSQLSNIVSDAFTEAGIPWATFHHLRHFGACYLISHGLPIEKVQRILGHSSINTTQIYARIKQDELKVAADIFDSPVSHIGGQ